MELLKATQFKGISFDIIHEVMKNGTFYLIMRMTNHNEKKKNLKLKLKYISKTCGLIDSYIETLDFQYPGTFLQPDAFVDLVIRLRSEAIKHTEDGDRIELEVNDGKVASLLLLKQSDQWNIMESKELAVINNDLKKLIEHFEGIEEKFGIVLQNFSVQVVSEYAVKLFCEVLALNGEIPEEGFNVEVAIYDKDNNILSLNSIGKSDGDFKGFEVFGFGEITLRVPVDEIGKIRFYPTR